MPIRSSISKVINRAEKAESNAELARKSATDAKDEASRMRWNITLGGILTALALVIGIAAFIVTVYSSLAPRVDRLQSRISDIESVSKDDGLQNLHSVTRELEDEVKALRTRVEELEQGATAGGRSSE